MKYSLVQLSNAFIEVVWPIPWKVGKISYERILVLSQIWRTQALQYTQQNLVCSLNQPIHPCRILGYDVEFDSSLFAKLVNEVIVEMRSAVGHERFGVSVWF